MATPNRLITRPFRYVAGGWAVVPVVTVGVLLYGLLADEPQPGIRGEFLYACKLQAECCRIDHVVVFPAKWHSGQGR